MERESKEGKKHNRQGMAIRSPHGVNAGGPGQLASRPNMDSPTPDIMVDKGKALFDHKRQKPGV